MLSLMIFLIILLVTAINIMYRFKYFGTLFSNYHTKYIFSGIKNDLMPIIGCSISLTFWSLYHVISISFCPKTRRGPKFIKK